MKQLTENLSDILSSAKVSWQVRIAVYIELKLHTL